MKARTILIALSVLLGIELLVGLRAVWLKGMNARLSSSAVRPWAKTDFYRRTSPGKTRPWPSASHSRPAASSVLSMGPPVVIAQPMDRDREFIDAKYFEAVEAGPSMEAALPQAAATTVKLSLIHI